MQQAAHLGDQAAQARDVLVECLDGMFVGHRSLPSFAQP